MPKLIDFHAHIYPDAIARRAVEGIERFYGVSLCVGNGTTAELVALLEHYRVSAVVCHAVATTPHQVGHINDFIAGEARRHSALIPFMTLHPALSVAEIKAEYRRARDLGCRGVKLHPDFQGFALDGEECAAVMKEIDPDFPVLFHTGDKRFAYSHPRQMIALAKRFPTHTLIAAHLGGFSEWEDAEGYLEVPNVRLDTSSTLPFLPPERVAELMRKIGIERFLFGTDYPMWSYRDELALFERLSLTSEELNAVLYDNAAKLLGFCPSDSQK